MRLIRERECKAKRLGWSWLVTDTSNNIASSNSLIKAGYKLYRPTFPWGFAHRLYWREQIAAN